MLRKSEIPNYPRFGFASSRAYEFLIELDICSFPVEPREIIKLFSNWYLVGYLELKYNEGVEDPLNLRKEKVEGKTVRPRGSNNYLIVYDEGVNQESRIRWTLAHEIGHIVLGHLDHFEATALNRRGLTQKEYGVLEVEAHWFAQELLAPRPIIILFRFGDSSDGIRLMCDISNEAAKKRFKFLKNDEYHKCQGKLIRNFYSHLTNKGYLAAVSETATRYLGSSVYPDFCKYCRICRHCNAFIDDEDHKFCHICGNTVPTVDTYSPMKSSDGVFYIGYDFKLKGRHYRKIQTAENRRVVFCPLCKNHKFSDEAQNCSICGTPLYNRCTQDGTLLDGSCRYCPDCGTEALFKEVYNMLPEPVNADSVPINLDDYIEYEYWNYIQMTIGYKEKDMDLYIALDGSLAYRDGVDFVVLVADKRDQELVNVGSDVIIRCLQNYGYVTIENVKCFNVS